MMKSCFKKFLIPLFSFLIVISVCAKNPNREFRGVWLHTIHQYQYQKMNKRDMQQYFTDFLDKMERLGMNALLFQVRSEADAFYKSNLEPWSVWFTGEQGKAPEEDWDPMEFLIRECHKRGIEFHAWINPYRIQQVANYELCKDNIYYTHPQWFVDYGGGKYFNPGLPESRNYICRIVEDIVCRYDIDGIHIDDYFYPYPVNGEEFPDDSAFQMYGERHGFEVTQRGDWRRNNVDKLIQRLFVTIKKNKPWVRFGVSPFGIYRNYSSTYKEGSYTKGLEGYTSLYGDVLKWDKEGWVDYVLPQLYWNIGHKTADYRTLLPWWGEHIENAQLYIGQSIDYSLVTKDNSQMEEKLAMGEHQKEVMGNCYFNAVDIINNKGKICEILASFHKGKALSPAYEHITRQRPNKVNGLQIIRHEDQKMLIWDECLERDWEKHAVKYAVYRFAKGERVNLQTPFALVAVTTKCCYIPENQDETCTYIVTALNRANIESKKVKIVLLNN